MAKSIKFTLDPYNNPLPSPEPEVREPVRQEPSQRPAMSFSPFKGEGHTLPEQEICILAFPVQTYKAISDEATARGLTMSQAVQQAFNLWFSSK